ncbi:RNA methyltransferase [uncultured Adlercreutzia sp.]|uniref:TrmH family RNA methyltransferase n=1 Tax=uncultured Adlercreutzia sp. TaxID=875803 RepID=UPI0026F39BE8|nr:RNA methyltransferase [uncultured Adlercreutzia sp.]
MPIVSVQNLDDPRLDAFARLTEAQLRSKLEPERALFIAESEKVIERAFEGGMEPISLLMEEKWLPSMASLVARMEDRLRALPEPRELPVFVAPRSELEKLTGFELTRGALGAFRRPALATLADTVGDGRLVAVLEDITNHTNVGAIFRSAAAMGVDAVLASPACYDPLYRRAVRVSMGTVFQVPWTRIGDTDVPNRPGEGTWSAEGIAQLKALGFTCAAMALSDDSITPDELNAQLAAQEAATGAPAKLALLFGTEGDGLAPATIARCDHTVRIPMAAGVDSLNVAASSAVAFYAFRRLSKLGRAEA